MVLLLKNSSSKGKVYVCDNMYAIIYREGIQVEQGSFFFANLYEEAYKFPILKILTENSVLAGLGEEPVR